MKFAKLHLVPALLLIAAVWLEIVASEYDAVYEGLLGRVVTPDFINQLTGSNGQTSNSNCESKPIVAEEPIDGSEFVYTDTPEDPTDEDKELTVSTGVDSSTPTGSWRTQDYDYYSSPVSSIGRNVEHNTANAISMARNQQTNRVRRRNPARRRKQQRRRNPARRRKQQRRRNPSRRRTQQRRRRQKRRRRPSAQRRRRPSAQKRKRPNRNKSKDRRRRRRGGQRKQHRRVIVRRRQANKRRNDERVERPQL